ncbi:hypothetical protein ACFFRR_001241 [Megaselia abdita]
MFNEFQVDPKSICMIQQTTFEPWLLNITTDLTLTELSKSETTYFEFQQKFHELLDKKHRNYEVFYTDGSVEDEKAFFAVICDSFSYKEWIKDHSSICTTELKALSKCLDIISSRAQTKFIIVIPRTSRYNQRERRCGGSLRVTSTSSTQNVGRSNSFRFNRPSSTGCTSLNSYCKHLKYCCLHQQIKRPNITQQNLHYQEVRRTGGDGCSTNEEEPLKQHQPLQQSSDNESHKLKLKNRPSILERSFECAESCDDTDTLSTTSSTPPITFNSLQRRRSSVHHRPPLPQHSHNSNAAVHQNVPAPRQHPSQSHQCGLRGENTTSASKLSLNQVISTYNSKTDLNSNHFERPQLRSEYSRSSNALYMNSYTDEHEPHEKHLTSSNLQLDKESSTSLARPNSINFHKSPVYRRRSSSIATNLLTRTGSMSLAMSDNKYSRNQENSNWKNWEQVEFPTNLKGKSSTDNSVLTLKQVLSGAVSPQYTETNSSGFPIHNMNVKFADSSDLLSPTETPSPLKAGSSANISQTNFHQRQRLRTSSMPAENRKPRLIDTRRSAIHCADVDMEYYRLRSFSITSHGVCNLGDSLRS